MTIKHGSAALRYSFDSRGGAVAIALLLLVFGLVAGTSAYAQDAGAIGFWQRLFGPVRPQPSFDAYARPAPWAGVETARTEAWRRRTIAARAAKRRRRLAARDRQRLVAVSRRIGSVSGFAAVTSGSPGGRTLCVRTCDGFVFPLGHLGSGGDLPVHAAACQAACPAAPTQLYTMGRGVSEENPAGARSVRDGSLYRDLAAAFGYRKQLAGGCSCHGPSNMSTPLPITEDRTLRHGDVVVDAGGVGRVFEGSGDAPHPPTAFAEFRRSRAIGTAERRQVDALLDVSRKEAVARAFARATHTEQAALSAPPPAGLQPVAPPAGSAPTVRAFRVVTASAGFAEATVARSASPTIIMVR